MPRYKKITVNVFRSSEDLITDEVDFSRPCETVKEAKEKAQYYITDEFQRSVESSQPWGYSQVIADGVCLYDYFRPD